ncbi:MAG: hypothetical protein EBX71_05195 [Betaproteobacteria bacterium]|nr:hypothetical protein [Betaproteobacteria bacterium]NCZ46488.1 hypothetical protein [Betaproteobacteria bacterium]NCZ59526.1 hypothetical protein [Betaproteobacteria bacterium]NDH43989.1 hypothetical protein [Betaproteobacteria bacterium]
MKLRDLFHVFRHPERESRCYELSDEEREAAARRIDELLAKRLKPSDLGLPTDPIEKTDKY